MEETSNPDLSWMIDASHNLKDPMEDLLQSVETIKIAYAKALLVDYNELKTFQQKNDVAACQSILQDAFRTDVRALVIESYYSSGGVIDPLKAYRELKIRQKLIEARGVDSKSTGL